MWIFYPFSSGCLSAQKFHTLGERAFETLRTASIFSCMCEKVSGRGFRTHKWLPPHSSCYIDATCSQQQIRKNVIELHTVSPILPPLGAHLAVLMEHAVHPIVRLIGQPAGEKCKYCSTFPSPSWIFNCLWVFSNLCYHFAGISLR